MIWIIHSLSFSGHCVLHRIFFSFVLGQAGICAFMTGVMPCCLCLWHICHHSKPQCHILDVYSRLCRYVDCHHPLVCLPRIHFQQWLAHVTRAEPL